MLRSLGFAAGPTIGARLIEVKFRPSGFDYLRIILAVLVTISHIPQNSYGDFGFAWEQDSVFAALNRFLLPSFFALSGFLVAGSLERCRTISAFVGLRMIRIFPALAVEVTLSALIMGPLLSALPVKDYIAQPEFRRYFLNLVGEIHYLLPGVFLANPQKAVVNAQLWTIPYELICYVSLVALVCLGLRKWRAVAPAFLIASLALFLLSAGVLHHWQWEFFGPANLGFRSGYYLVCDFLCGITLYYYRDKIRLNRATCIACCGLIVISTIFNGPLAAVYPIAAAYLTVMIGLTNPRRIWLLQGADYSYGVYLYHYVIFQVVAQFFPFNAWAIALIGLPVVVVFSAFSWHVVEKPAMLLRGPLMAGDRNRELGNALMVSAFVAASIVGFVISYNTYPFFNPERSRVSEAGPAGLVADR